MKEIKMRGLDETIYESTLDNGLRIYIWQSKTSHSFKGNLIVSYGADNTTFTVKGKKYEMTRGSAHYLEHVMCENVDKEPLLSLFNKLGSHSNAYTNYKKTSFEFTGSKNLKENIELLLSNIFEKKFNQENFEHERVPILEEQRMREDNPGVIAYFKMNKMLFSKYPNGVDLIGTEEDINNITFEEIKTIYKYFYHPSNMCLVVTGNVSPYEVVKIVKDYFQNKDFPPFKSPIIKNYKEGKKVVSKKEIIKANVEIPELTINIKIPLKIFEGFEETKLFNIVKLILASNFGSTSLFKEELLEKKLIYNLFFGAYKVYDYMIIEVGCRTKYPADVEKILYDKLNNMEIDEKDINRKIKSVLATLIVDFEDQEEVNALISSYLTYENRIIDNEKEILESITLKDIENVHKLLSFKESSSLIMMPKEEE